MSYQPKPIDTNSVELPADLLKLSERLAENAHELWARQRFADGWSLGPQRDDQTKKHPSLIPYRDLSEAEKRYDHEVAIGTLKAIVAMGYRIEKARE